MTLYNLIFAPDPIFKKKAEPVSKVTDDIRIIIDNMFETLYAEKAVGIGANMLGILKRIAIVDLYNDNKPNPYTFINPEITWKSDTMQTFEEASLCFPGISANITRPSEIELSYLDYNGKQCKLKADGFFATVIQHEIDYLDGTIFLDHISKMKRDLLLKKMQKHQKLHPPHVHSSMCNH